MTGIATTFDRGIQYSHTLHHELAAVLGGIVTEGVFANTLVCRFTRSRIVSVRSDSCERNSAMNGTPRPSHAARR